jgi:hypothetical protein
MGFFGGYFGASVVDGGGSGSPPSPGNSVTTTELIRERIITVVEAITPTVHASLPFVAYRDEAGADFRRWARAHPSECTRRFQARLVSSARGQDVSNMYTEARRATFDIIVAYAKRWRAGSSFDRDDTMDVDQGLIEGAVGMNGYANFALSNPNATWLAPSAPGSQTDTSFERDVDNVDFLVIRQTMRFFRSTT